MIILTRNTTGYQSGSRLNYASWDPEKETVDHWAIHNADCIVNLAGANIADGRWTEQRKKEILDSRVRGSRLLFKSLKEIPNKVRCVISNSATGYYGADASNARPFEETSPSANDFLAKVTKQWEQSIQPVTQLNKRLVIFRVGIVLSKDGGAFQQYLRPLKLGVAAVPGNGQQIMSWIHIHDLVRLYINTIEQEKWSGVYNAVAPHPVSQNDLLKTMSRYRKFHIPIHVPAFVLRAMLGEMSTEILKSVTVSSQKLEREGFEFQFPNVDVAVADLMRR